MKTARNILWIIFIVTRFIDNYDTGVDRAD